MMRNQFLKDRLKYAIIKFEAHSSQFQPPMLNINENDAESLMTAANSLNSLEDARDSLLVRSLYHISSHYFH